MYGHCGGFAIIATYKEMICSKSYGTHSQMLADEIATLARRLVIDTIPHNKSGFFKVF